MAIANPKITIPTSIGCFAISVVLGYVHNWAGAILFFVVGLVLALMGA